jgi:hypothetical protein
MDLIGPAFAGVLAVIAPTIAQADGLEPNIRPKNAGPLPGIVLAWDGGGSGRGSSAPGHPAAGHIRRWKGGWFGPQPRPSGIPFGPGPYGWQGAPTYWVWGPNGGAFDYPFADWRGPTGGWGNP